MKKRTGLFFGTFNPIHIGHCIIAQYMLEYTDLEEIWFVVTPHNPHKKKSSLLNDRERLFMVHLAIEDQYNLRASDMEFDLPQPNYTAVTLAHAGEKWPDREFCLIMGLDNLKTFHKWRNYEWILEKHPIYVYPRMNTVGGKLVGHPQVTITQAPAVQISSTFIREALRDGKDVSFMLPPAVWDHLRGSSAYR